MVWVEIGLVRTNGAGGVQIFESAEQRVNVVAQPFGNFALAEATRDLPLAAVVGELIREYLAEEAPSGVFLKAEDANDREASRAMALRSLESGVVEISHDGEEPGESEAISLAEASVTVAQFLAAA